MDTTGEADGHRQACCFKQPNTGHDPNAGHASLPVQCKCVYPTYNCEEAHQDCTDASLPKCAAPETDLRLQPVGRGIGRTLLQPTTS